MSSRSASTFCCDEGFCTISTPSLLLPSLGERSKCNCLVLHRLVMLKEIVSFILSLYFTFSPLSYRHAVTASWQLQNFKFEKVKERTKESKKNGRRAAQRTRLSARCLQGPYYFNRNWKWYYIILHFRAIYLSMDSELKIANDTHRAELSQLIPRFPCSTTFVYDFFALILSPYTLCQAFFFCRVQFLEITTQQQQ